ncbi:MAG: heavy metal translocating P-type ATPase [Pelovirga sp.]
METIEIGGMKCSKCVARVTDILQGVSAIDTVRVDLAAESADLILVTGQSLPLDEIDEALSAAGFFIKSEPADADTSPTDNDTGAEITSDQSREQLRFSIGGMSCTSCAATIEKKLSSQPGIDQVRVNLAGNFAQVDFQPKRISPQEIYAAVEQVGFRAAAETDQTEVDASRKELLMVLVAAAGAVPIMLMMFAPVPYRVELLVSGVLATIVQFSAGLSFYRSAWLALKNRTANMDVLVSLGITAAYGYSMLALLGLLGDEVAVFFETSVMLILFIRFGKWLESRAKGRAGSALKKLLQLQADTAVLVVDGRQTTIPVEQVKPGDTLLVRPGDTIPVDGEVIEGTAAVDESMITGESVPVHKETGTEVIGATINRSGLLYIKATRVGEDAVLARIVRLVENAQADKAPIQRFADRVSAFFVPVVVALSLFTFVVWYLVVHAPFLTGFQMAIAVVVIACPCALGLATPTAIMVGSAVGLERGILYKKASVLEMISRLDVILLDKTGTLTSGEFKVNNILTSGKLSADDVLALAAALEQGSNHPLAQAVVAAARERGIAVPEKSDKLEEIGGQGVRGFVNDQFVVCGNKTLMDSTDISTEALVEQLQQEHIDGKSLVFVAVEGRLQGVIALSDQLRPSAAAVVKHLHQLDIATVLVSGDRQAVVASVASQLGIDRAVAEVTPDRKLALVKEYQQQGQRVGMVGDGINDAPALAQADVGIAIGTGTDVARETGDLVLIGADLFDLVRAVELGRQTLKKIKQNLFWAFFYNLSFIPLAAGLFYSHYGLYLKPEYAGLAMALSSVCVVLNSLTLKRVAGRLEAIR